MVSKVSPASLLYYYGNKHSQCGQDGILAEIFRRINIQNGVFIEFGAWDGIHLSNCRYLYEKGWNGLFIEADKEKFKSLQATYSSDAGISLANAMVGAPSRGVAGHTLIDILHQGKIDPNIISFVSIDVDGVDLEIFQEMGFSPPVVLIEGGFNFSPHLTQAIPSTAAWNNLQQPLAVIVNTAKEIGYTPVCYFQDTYFVRTDLVKDYGMDTLSLYSDAWNFAPIALRNYLLRLRAEHPLIKAFEELCFGRFSPNPLESHK